MSFSLWLFKFNTMSHGCADGQKIKALLNILKSVIAKPELYIIMAREYV